MVKYMTESIQFGITAKITPIEIEKESESSVWIKGRCNKKITQYYIYHNTWEEAHAYLMLNAENNVRAALRSAENANIDLTKVKGMTCSN